MFAANAVGWLSADLGKMRIDAVRPATAPMQTMLQRLLRASGTQVVACTDGECSLDRTVRLPVADNPSA